MVCDLRDADTQPKHDAWTMALMPPYLPTGKVSYAYKNTAYFLSSIPDLTTICPVPTCSKTLPYSPTCQNRIRPPYSLEMCWNDIAPIKMLCGHRGPDGPSRPRPCGQNPCVTGGVHKANYLATTRKRDPCDDCIADETWTKVGGQWKRA